MRLVIGTGIIFSVVILFLFALFPSDISVTRLIRIHQSADQVIKKVADLPDWKNWNEFLLTAKAKGYIDPERDRIDPGVIHAPEFTIERIKILPNTVITRWFHGIKSFTGNFVMTAETKDQTIVEWTLYFHIHWYPWEKLASMFYDKQLGPVMEKSLLNLQREMEGPVL